MYCLSLGIVDVHVPMRNSHVFARVLLRKPVTTKSPCTEHTATEADIRAALSSMIDSSGYITIV